MDIKETSNTTKSSINNFQTLVIILLLIIIGITYGDYLTLEKEVRSEYFKGYKQGTIDMKNSILELNFKEEQHQQQLNNTK